MRVLVACEFSGIVREAFRKLGHDAWSCDVIQTETEPANYHFMCHVESVLELGWDLMIAHPPCTYLANSGVRWLYGGKGNVPDPERWGQMEEAALFFRQLLDAPINRIAIENPIQHRHAGLPEKTQVIQPWMFGHGETKATCLWLKNLPKLVPTNIVEGRNPRVHYASPGPERWKERSRTLQGIADAMAEQWGNV